MMERMYRITQYCTFSVLALFLPLIAKAQIATEGGGGQFEVLLKNILNFANSVLIPFIIGIGFLVFVWGMFQYFIAGGASEESREKGKSLMINATFGFVIIIIFFGMINLLTSSTGLEGQYIQNVPRVDVPN
jgi:Type IV secretion system pilin